MPHIHDILFETNRFNYTQPKSHFINETCYGDDVAIWLRAELSKRGISSTEPNQEDWGWSLNAQHEGSAYFIGIGHDVLDEPADTGKWRLLVEKRRTILEKLLGKNKFTDEDKLTVMLVSLIVSEPDMSIRPDI